MPPPDPEDGVRWTPGLALAVTKPKIGHVSSTAKVRLRSLSLSVVAAWKRDRTTGQDRLDRNMREGGWATHTAAAVGALVWVILEWIHRDKPTVLGIASGAVAGLATVTPASGYIGPFSAICIGLGAGIACYFAVIWKSRMGYDDSLDVVGIHGVGGVLGIVATGLLASKAVNSAGADGLFFGNPAQLGIQLLTVMAVGAFSCVGTYAILKLVDLVVGLRVSEEDELTGLDLSQHDERAYS